MRRACALALALVALILPVLADGEDSPAGPDSFVPEIMSAHNVKEGNYAVAFMSLYDSEKWLCNGEEYFKVASVYKLPLNMYFYELESLGEIDPEERIAGMSLEQCHYYSLEYSHNAISEAMLDYLGGYSQYKRDILKYTGSTSEDVAPEYYYDNAFTAEMVLNILDFLSANSGVFSEQIEHMLAAQPGEYLESGELGCEIAQKYGYQNYDGVLHIAVAGIVYAEEPFLLAILTRGSYGAAAAMGEICDAFASWEAGRVSLSARRGRSGGGAPRRGAGGPRRGRRGGSRGAARRRRCRPPPLLRPLGRASGGPGRTDTRSHNPAGRRIKRGPAGQPGGAFPCPYNRRLSAVIPQSRVPSGETVTLMPSLT